MVSKIATFRLPEQLTQEIRFRAETTGRDRTAVVIDALKQAFGLPPGDPRPATVEEIQDQINELEQKYKALSHQLTELTQTSILERQISQFSSETTPDVSQWVSRNGSLILVISEFYSISFDII